MATTKGIDISKHQGEVDFQKLKGEVDFVIIRAGYGDSLTYPNQIDSYFEKNYKGCKENGLPCGVYWYSYATTEAGAKQEARSCLAAIEGKVFEYPIYFDLEEQSQFAQGKAVCSKLVSAFCTEIENAGYYVGLYMSRSPLQSYISEAVANRYTLWIAEYASKLNYSGNYGMWQYSSKGSVSGISGNVDMNLCCVDFPAIIKQKGLNGMKEEILDTSGFKSGDKSNGVLALKELLLLAKAKKLHSHGLDENGIFGSGTVKAVNALLKSWGYTQNGIAGERFIKILGQKLR